MGIFGNIRNAIAVDGDSLSQPTGWLQRLLAMTQTSSGIAIHEGNALTVGDVYKCINVISETVAMLPWKLYRNLDPRGREEARKHPLYFLLHDEPNERMTSFTYRQAMLYHMLIWGRHASYMERDSSGKIVALWPLRPDLFYWQIRDGKMWFYVSTMDGIPQQFWEDEILYIPGLTRDGYNAYSPVALHRETLGLTKALEVFGAKLFGSGSMPGGFLKHPGNLSKEAAQRLKESFEEKHRGLDTAHRLAVLEEGLEYVPNPIDPEKAQFILSRQFQRADLAGLWRVPPHKIGDLSRSTNNNIEHQDLEFLRDCIAPKLTSIEQACNRCLLLPREKGKFFNEFVVGGMMRGDTAARTQHCKEMFMIGAYSDNMVLEYMGENPIEGGDRHFVPMNMVPLDQVDNLDNAEELNQDGQPILRARAAQTVLQRATKANERFFRDAVGRVTNRKPADRKNYATTAFLQPVLNVFEGILGQISTENETFSADLVDKIAADCDVWVPECADSIAHKVLNHVVLAVLERSAK
jgi:HK97 family phage portal protein